MVEGIGMLECVVNFLYQCLHCILMLRQTAACVTNKPDQKTHKKNESAKKIIMVYPRERAAVPRGNSTA